MKNKLLQFLVVFFSFILIGANCAGEGSRVDINKENKKQAEEEKTEKQQEETSKKSVDAIGILLTKKENRAEGRYQEIVSIKARPVTVPEGFSVEDRSLNAFNSVTTNGQVKITLDMQGKELLTETKQITRENYDEHGSKFTVELDLSKIPAEMRPQSMKSAKLTLSFTPESGGTVEDSTNIDVLPCSAPQLPKPPACP